MMEKETQLQRYAGYLVLLLVAVLLLVGLRLGVLAEEGQQDRGEDSGPGPRETAVFFRERSEDKTQPGDLQAEPLPIISDKTLAPAPVPGTYQGKKPFHEFDIYTVERGDTPSGIAYQFGIKTETLLGGNPKLSQESSLMQPGMDLIILPIDAVLHDVELGDTLESISAEYGIPVEDIIAYEPNNLEFPFRLYPDTQILVPGAVAEVFVWTPPTLSTVRGGTSREGSGVAPAIVGTGTFVFPVSSSNFTQRFWYGHPGIDVALSEGSGVFASDTGTVTFAGWNIYGYGNLVVINHGNGYETFYGHLSAINVFPGQIVYQGNVIGAVGNTGNSSGPHVHFEVRTNGNQDDPCWYLGC
ncbi:MAG: peptidoglycan DD-metalloendopeptidase family protein [Chloroflexi bacterium]|jgi:LysM repeat protein|nr:peptidoglycan DD-metalloendopeptidase family protein [Chloroflexota bacterium]